ncbi:DUF456 domain-containing protein [Patescibacteria group bacterium]
MWLLIAVLKIISWVIIILGLLGVFLPLLPSALLVFVGGVLLALFSGTFSWLPIIILGLFWILSQIIDILSTSWGAKKMGATKYGAYLAPIGSIFGFLIAGILGMLILSIAFAIFGEIIFGKKDLKSAAKSGFGVILGILISQILGIIIIISMIGIIIQFFI